MGPESAGEEPEDPRRQSVALGSAARLVAEVGAAGLALVTSIVIARRLGPEGKGVISTLSYLVALLAPVLAFGLGDAAVVLAARGTASARHVTAVVLGAILLFVAIGAPLGALVARLQVDGLSWVALGAVGLGVGGATVARAVTVLVEGQHDVVFASAARLAVTFFTLAGTVALVVVWPLGVTGGVVAVAVGWAVSGGALLGRLRRILGPLRPCADRHLLRDALAIGVPVQVGYVLVSLHSRIDLLLVEALRDVRDAGLYSVSLTVAQLGTYPAIALAVAAYPRVAEARPEDLSELLGRMARAAVLASIGAAVALAAIIPWATTLLFGFGFGRAVTPAMILLVGAALSGPQWVFARASAARGSPRPLVASYGASVGTMVALDLLLVPRLGMNGAAVAAVAAAAVGLAIATQPILRLAGPQSGLRMLVPGRRDVNEFSHLARHLLDRRER